MLECLYIYIDIYIGEQFYNIILFGNVLKIYYQKIFFNSKK